MNYDTLSANPETEWFYVSLFDAMPWNGLLLKADVTLDHSCFIKIFKRYSPLKKSLIGKSVFNHFSPESDLAFTLQLVIKNNK